MIADHSFLLIDPKNEEKTAIVILMSLCTRDKIPSSGFRCAGETQRVWTDTVTICLQILVDAVV